MEINIPKNSSFNRLPDPSRWLIPLALFFLLLSSFGSMFYQVEAGEVGVVQQFGKYVRTEEPGLHFKWPLNIEVVHKVRPNYANKEEFGFQTLRASTRSEFSDSFIPTRRTSRRASHLSFQKNIGFPDNSFLYESMMLTGDLNLAVVEWIVQYRFSDPYKALFKVRNVNDTVRDMSEAVMRQVVGDHTVDEVITMSRTDIEEEARTKLQALLDKFDSGVSIIQVVLQNVNPPDEVKPSFNDVNAARQDMERSINQAWEDYNKFVPKARGDAERLIREAEGYALKRVNNAEGEAHKFLAIWEEYQTASDITRKRMYLESMTDLFRRIPRKVIIDQDLKGLLPLMDINKMAGLDKNTLTEGGAS